MHKAPTYIDFIVSPQSAHSIEVTGGDGKTCTTLTAPFEQVTGGVGPREFKPEHFRARIAAAATTRVGR